MEQVFDPLKWKQNLRYRKWEKGEDDKLMMTHPETWSITLHPILAENGELHKCLPLVKKIQNNTAYWEIRVGFIQEDCGPVVHPYPRDNWNPIEYDSFDDLIADGWRVD